MIRQYGWLFSIFGTPVVVLLSVISYARSKTTVAGQIGTFVLFIPVIVIATVMWLLAWSFAIWLVFGLFSN